MGEVDVEPVSSRSAARMLELYWLGFGRASGPPSLSGFQFPVEPPGPDRTGPSSRDAASLFL